MTLTFTVLGSGSSSGVPAAGGFWGDCDPGEPKNHRTRASLLVQSATTNIVVDATLDLRAQMNRHTLQRVDAVLLTHDHSDHVNGLDDLRAVFFHNGRKLIDLYSNEDTLRAVAQRWPYLFKARFDVYAEFLRQKAIDGYGTFRVGDIDVESFEQDHKVCTSLGFRFGSLAYSTDVVRLNEKSLQALRGVETWIVDAGSYRNDNITTHANLAQVLEWVDILRPKMTYLTVLGRNMDYATLCAELPPHIRPAYDGMVMGPT